MSQGVRRSPLGVLDEAEGTGRRLRDGRVGSASRACSEEGPGGHWGHLTEGGRTAGPSALHGHVFGVSLVACRSARGRL